MPTNLTKKYPDLLELSHLNEYQRTVSLKRIFCRDIQENECFKFRCKTIRPVKKEGLDSMETLFDHLTKRSECIDGIKTRDVFEIERSRRLHWIRFHVEQRCPSNILIFSYIDRLKNRGDVIRTYVFDTVEDYIIILEPQRSNLDYYLITAYYLNEPGGKNQILKKLNRKLDEIY